MYTEHLVMDSFKNRLGDGGIYSLLSLFPINESEDAYGS